MRLLLALHAALFLDLFLCLSGTRQDFAIMGRLVMQSAGHNFFEVNNKTVGVPHPTPEGNGTQVKNRTGDKQSHEQARHQAPQVVSSLDVALGMLTVCSVGLFAYAFDPAPYVLRAVSQLKTEDESF
mmetsp:Transcript_42811/g.66658  ORF Transcript_42811/g.66658 Transcript_42811/m.66658 type:complete len:127 (-) Transcript_42811:30-410(-)